jgi:hypothetical protein
VRPWTLSELDNVISALEPLKGLRLQEVQTGAEDIVLGFYSSQGVLWLWVDLNALSPGLLPWIDLPRRLPAEKTPLLLFLRAHFVGRTLRSIDRPEGLGRVVRLHFGAPEDALELELRLFPHGRNLIARVPGKHSRKQISWQKIEELSDSKSPTLASERAIRSLDELRDEWKAAHTGKGSTKSGGKVTSLKSVDPRQRLENDLRKKTSALAKVHEELKRKREQPWREVGDWLKTNQSLAVPKEWELYVDRRRKLAWNIEECFKKAREGDSKILGTERRLAQLQNEIQTLTDKLNRPASELKNEVPRAVNQPTLAKIEAQGRTLHLNDELTAVMGKSAADNMKILRKARAWDLWFHLRDYPSSHAVLFRNKNTEVGDAKLFEVAAWFVRNQLGVKAAQHAGEKFDLVVTECRFVRPIKGDKIGRVHYHDERLLIYQFPG